MQVFEPVDLGACASEVSDDSLWTSDSRASVAALFAASAADLALRICQMATAKPPKLTANAVTPTMKFAQSIVEDCKRLRV